MYRVESFYGDYDWFLGEVEAIGGIMNTDYATMNYVTIEELNNLENIGIIARYVEDGNDFIEVQARHPFWQHG